MASVAQRDRRSRRAARLPAGEPGDFEVADVHAPHRAAPVRLFRRLPSDPHVAQLEVVHMADVTDVVRAVRREKAGGVIESAQGTGRAPLE
ncbi:MAG: hypothetical protein NT090_03240 [Acidobacteria bacterium]|nr:hypothetical protein [Acidobacteriota bacterium]